MNRRALSLFLFAIAPATLFLGACGTFSTDPAPGGITASETGMNVVTVKEWQDDSINRLAY